MEIRHCKYHHIQTIKGGLVTKVFNVFRGRPKLSFKSITDIHEHESLLFDNDNAKAVRSCIEVMKEGIVKTKSDDWVCNADDGDIQKIHNLVDEEADSAILTLKQIKESCKERKRKRSQGLDSSKIKIEDPSTLEFNMEKQQMEEDDPDFRESLRSLRTKLSTKMKTKKKNKKCIKEDTMPSQEIGLESKDAEITLECISLRGVKPASMDIAISNSELRINQSTNFPAIEFEEHDNSDIVDKQLDDDTDISVSPPEVASHKDLDSMRVDITSIGDCSKDEFTAGAEVQEKLCVTVEHGLKPDIYQVCCSDYSPEYEENQSLASLSDDHTGTPVSPSKVTSQKDLECEGLEITDDNTVHNDCCKDEYTAGAEVQDKLCPTIEHGLNPDVCLDHHLDDSPGYEEKQSFASSYNGQRIHVNKATDELISSDEHERDSKLHTPERLLSTRKAISPSFQEMLCKAMDSIDINHKKNPKCKGELQFTEQTDKTGDADVNDIMNTEVTNNPKKIRFIHKTTKSGSNLKGVSKIRNSSRSATRVGWSTLQNQSESAIAFSKQQMQDAENLAVRLTKELNSMKDIVDDMLRSEFCLNTSLRYKVNEAIMAVKSATKAEEGAKRWLSFMSRDCNRFCKIMKLADSSMSTPQGLVSPPHEVVRKERKIAFADEAGGKLCHVRFYEDDEGHLSESK